LRVKTTATRGAAGIIRLPRLTSDLVKGNSAGLWGGGLGGGGPRNLPKFLQGALWAV